MFGFSLAVALALSVPDSGADAGRDAGVPSGAPAGLACLPQWYAGTVVKQDGGWGLWVERGDAGTFLPWAWPARDAGPGDGGPDGGEPDLEAHDVATLSDIYAPPYSAGPIVPVDTSDAGAINDPGRARVEQLFLATYGANRDEVQDHLHHVRFFGLRYPFHERAADALARVAARLEPQVRANAALLPFLRDIGGTWIWRRIARSKNLSTHAWGIAIDLNVDRSHYWRWTFRGEPLRWKNKIPQAIVDAFEAEGFIWGGRWAHYDTMHFEYRPELISPDCREGPAGGQKM